MVTLEAIREYMRNQAEEDRSLKMVEVSGKDLDDAIEQAAIELGLPVKLIEYEVKEPGSKGLFGFGRKDCVIVAYERVEVKPPPSSVEVEEEIFGNVSADAVMDKDGEVIVRLTPDGVLMKVTPPSGRGKKATERMAYQKLAERAVTKYDENLISRVVKAADGQYVKVGDFIYNPSNDAFMALDISDFEMKAFITARPPGPGGSDLSFDSIVGFLKSNNVIHGINEERILEFEDHPVYNQPVLVAEGTKPVNGDDAKIVYTFETNRSVKLKEVNGKVDFREMNLIQNVVEGQVLAKKIPAKEGVPGRTVTGKLLPAKSGRDVAINAGQNVKLSEDGMTATAMINGQVILSGDKINVEPILVIQGDVNLKNGGNVIFLGTVLVKGSVEDGFKVKAAGNIEVLGNVGKCEIDAEGDVIVHQGINGKSGGVVKSSKGVWAKFIENSTVDAGDIVVASDGIINSNVLANKKVVCQGKRATIVGGRIRAAEEIRAKTLGSVAGSETILEVGYDPKSRAALLEIEGKIAEIDRILDEVNLNIGTLENFKRARKELPDDKEKYYEELKAQQADLVTDKARLSEEKQKIETYLSSLKIRGRISASSKVFPGVKVYIKDAFLEVKNEFRAVTFINELGMVKVTKYEESDEDFSRRG
ncbi:MAG TPA: FapA family protein [Spirochaetia bacterium]|nr:FapA family protein [Spirochaetia bacterium]